MVYRRAGDLRRRRVVVFLLGDAERRLPGDFLRGEELRRRRFIGEQRLRLRVVGLRDRDLLRLTGEHLLRLRGLAERRRGAPPEYVRVLIPSADFAGLLLRDLRRAQVDMFR